MLTAINSTEVRKDWGRFIDSVIREKPKAIKRSRDYILAFNVDMFKEILKTYTFTVKLYKEEDNTTTAELEEIDIVVNAEDEEKALTVLASDLKEYAEEYYNDFNYWFSAPNRKKHFPYVLNVLLQDNINGIKALIKCQAGEN